MNITVSDQNYQVGGLSALNQFHLVRRLAPLLGAAGTSFDPKLLRSGVAAEDFLPLMIPLVNQLAQMSDADTEYIIFLALSVVKRQTTDGSYAPVLAAGTDQLMFQDIDMNTMLKLVGAVIKHNLSGFFDALGGNPEPPSTSQPTAPGSPR